MKFFYLNKSQGYILATLLCLVFLGSCYFFIYLPANEKRVEEERFRTLQNVDRNIHDKIDNSVSLLKNLLDHYNSNRASKGRSDYNRYLQNYIYTYPSDKFSLSQITEIPHRSDSLQDSLKIEVNNATRKVSVVLSNVSNAGVVKDSLPQVSLKYTFDQFIAGLLPEVVFDEYLVFSNGNIVYESFPSGIGRVKDDSLLNSTNGINGSYAKDITAGGKEYKLFLHAVTFDTSHKWVLGGLLSKGSFQKERSQLPSNLLLMMVTILIGTIVIFPWIKLYQMGSKDRLTIADGTSSIVVAMLLMSLLFFCFFKYNNSIRNHNNFDSKSKVDSLVTTAFYKETARHYDILKNYDRLRSDLALTSIVNLHSRNVMSDTSVVNTSTHIKPKTFDSVRHILAWDSARAPVFIKQVFWLDSAGAEKYTWTTDRFNAPLNNLSGRNYFKNIADGKPYYLYGDTTKEYYLDQVVSKTTGVFTSILAMPSQCIDSRVVAMSFTMQSVNNVVLPAGYSFAITDDRGKVLYHSMPSRNLNENIKSEFADSAAITSSIDTRNTAEFNTRYYNRNYTVRIAPVKGLPYFIVILSDNSYIDTRDVEIYSFTFSMLLLFFLYMLAQLSITFLVSSRRSFFKKQLFDTSWIGPKLSFHKEYLLGAAVNIGLIFLLILCFRKASFFQYIFLLLFIVVFISLFINRLFARRYLQEGKTNNRRYKQVAVRACLVLLVLLNAASAMLLELRHFLEIFSMELVITIAGFILTDNLGRLPARFVNKVSSWFSYTQSFSLMALTCLIITSGLPVAFFYKTSYDYEQNTGVRYRQADYASRLLLQKALTPQSLPAHNRFGYDTTGVYYDTTYVRSLPVIASDSDFRMTSKAGTYEGHVTNRILAAFHLAIGDKYAKSNHTYEQYSSDLSIISPPVKSRDTLVNTYIKAGNRGRYLKLSAYNMNYDIPAPYWSRKAFLYWFLMVLGLFLFYMVINNIVKKLFCLNLPNLDLWKELDEKMLDDDKLNKFLLVIGLPGAHKFKYITGKIQDGAIRCSGNPLTYSIDDKTANNVFVADLINIPDKGANIATDKDWIAFTEEVINLKYRLVIINHFEYNMQDDYTNLAKLELLEKLMIQGKSKIIILSTLHPLAFLDSLNDTGKQADAVQKPVHDMERWHVLLGHYRISIMPITRQQITCEPAWMQLICAETQYTHYLQDMQQVTLGIAANTQERDVVEKADLLAYKLQVTSQYFYMYIWQSLTKEEKFLLYDLAEDNLVNSFDDYNLTMLIAKGVIVQSNGLLRLFNRGFRNFILTAIGNTEVLKIKDRIKESGNWGNLKTPLVIIIFAILAFLLISQQEAYSRLLTYVAALSAGVPAVLKIFSLFYKDPAKGNS